MAVKKVLLRPATSLVLKYIPIDSSREHIFDQVGKLWEGTSQEIIDIPYDSDNAEMFIDSIDEIDKKRLKKHKITIDIKSKDMPDEILLIGDEIFIACNYTKGNKPSLGNRITIFHDSYIMWDKPSEETPNNEINKRPTEIGNNVILGPYCNIHGTGLIVKDNVIIGGMFNSLDNGLLLEENVFFRCGIADTGLESARFIYRDTVESNNVIGRNADIGPEVVLPGNVLIPPYAKVTKNVPLIFSENNLVKFMAETL